MIRNLDECAYSEKDGEYGGISGLKEGLVIDGENWLVKYPKNAEYLSRHEEMLYTNDPVSEYIGSHVYRILGYPVQETFLGYRKEKIVVACKDFLKQNERLVEMRTLKNSANNDMAEKLDKEFGSTGSAHVIEFEEIMLHLQYNRILKNVEGIKERFFDQIVVDVFINNTDRNNGNWGIIRSTGCADRLAPIYDNGGSFHGKTPDSRIKRMLEKDAVSSCVLNGISVYGKEGKQYKATEILKLDIPELRKSIIKNVPLLKKKMSAIYEFIDQIEDVACSSIRKDFYKKGLQERLNLILQPVYNEVLEKEQQINQVRSLSKPRRR